MKLKITVHGVAYEVDVEVLDASDEMQQAASPLPAMPPAAAARGPLAAPTAAAAGPAPAAGEVNGVASPIAGTVLQVKCRVGDQAAAGQDLLVIEAMKMETAIAAPTPGRIKAILVAAGDTVRESQLLIEFE